MKFAEGDKVVTDSIDIVTKSVVKYMIRAVGSCVLRKAVQAE